MFEKHFGDELLENEQSEFDFYLQFEWPEHIERALRRLLWIALVEAALMGDEVHSHTQLLRWMIATHPESPPQVLEYLCRFEDESLLERIAENPKTSAHVLARLAQHASPRVRMALADSQNVPITVLLQLVCDPDADVRYCLAENHALPSKILLQLREDSNVYVSARAERTLHRRHPKAQVLHLPDEQRKAM